MKSQSLGFIGGGRITKIILQAFVNTNSEFSSISVYDTNIEITDTLKKQFPNISIVDSSIELANKDILIIALHPPVIMDSLDNIKEVLHDNVMVLSLAPKITIQKIKDKLEIKNVARLIPNATSYINEGYNPVCFSNDFTPSTKQLLMDILNILGKTFEVEEQKLEAYAIISAMLPTYFWFQWQELEKIGIKTGLTKMESKEAIKETMLSAIHLLYNSELSSSEVIDLIPVKPIADSENAIKDCFNDKLIPLFEKIKP